MQKLAYGFPENKKMIPKQFINHFGKLLALIIVLSLNSGCSTIMARTSSKYYPQLYPGINFYFSDFLQHPHMIPKWLSIPSGILDVPASFVVDTLCLPVDMANTLSNESKIKESP